MPTSEADALLDVAGLSSGYGKIGDLAFGFQGGVGAWQAFAPEDDASDEATIKAYRDKWRAAHPRTVQFWYAIDRAAINAVQRPHRWPQHDPVDQRALDLNRLGLDVERPTIVQPSTDAVESVGSDVKSTLIPAVAAARATSRE